MTLEEKKNRYLNLWRVAQERYSMKAKIIDLLNKASVRELEMILWFVRSFLR